ncbi:MAG: efflux transporter outer membrane subunit [Gallionellaceae bacterium]|jgi:NodT family efflux transporter outer membrane factor (OMF) lipoprotein|nr:efflux transporter outer membrane subunit [Gallionellaceae bacterium]
MRKTLIIFSVLLGLSGCASMGNIAPQSRLTDANTLKTGLPEGHAAWPSERWWERYGDAQLNGLIDAALRDSPTLRVAEARARQARAAAGIAEAATKLTGGINASFSHDLFTATEFIPPPWAGSYNWENNLTANVSYNLDLWGRNRDALSAAIDETKVAQAESQMARLGLENQIVRAYLQLALQYTLKDTLEATLRNRQRGLEVTKKRQAAGLATEVEVSQIEALIPALQTQIEQRAEAIILLHHQLAALIGQGPEAGEAIKRPELNLASDDWLQLPATLPADLIGRRPDVAARRWGVEAAAHGVKASKAAFYPNINLIAYAGYQGFGFNDLLSAASAVRGIGPAISLPIFDGTRLRGNLAAQTASYDVAVESYNETVLHALESVAGTLASAQSAQQQKHLVDAGVAAAAKAHDLAGKGYAAGLTDFLVVLSSQVLLLQQQDAQAVIVSRQLESYADLMLALGGGWDGELSTQETGKAQP